MQQATNTLAPDVTQPLPGQKPAAPTVSPDATRWIWQPLRDIDLRGPHGHVKLFGKDNRYYDKIERGKVYPLYNTWLNVKLPPETDAGNSLNLEAGAPGTLRDERVTRTAYDCALDFKLTYEDLCGGTVFESLTGMAREQVADALAIVLPTIYSQLDSSNGNKTGTWLGDLIDGGGAAQRIKAAKLDDVSRQRLDRLRKEALGGLNIAIRVAKEARASLIKSMAQASIGRAGQANGDGYDEAMCELIGVPVPTTIMSDVDGGAPAASPSSEAILTYVIEQQAREKARDEEMAKMREEITALRKEKETPKRERAAKNAAPTQPDKDDDVFG